MGPGARRAKKLASFARPRKDELHHYVFIHIDDITKCIDIQFTMLYIVFGSQKGKLTSGVTMGAAMATSLWRVRITVIEVFKLQQNEVSTIFTSAKNHVTRRGLRYIDDSRLLIRIVGLATSAELKTFVDGVIKHLCPVRYPHKSYYINPTIGLLLVQHNNGKLSWFPAAKDQGIPITSVSSSVHQQGT